MKKNVIKLSVLAFALTGIVSLSSCKNTESENDVSEVDNTDMEQMNENSDNAYPSNATAEYLAYVDRSTDESENKLYTEQAINKLAAAVEEKSQDLKANPSDSLRTILPEDNTTEMDTTITTDSLYTKGQIIVGVLENLQKDNFPELSEDVESLKASWKKLEEAKKTNYKETAVNSFFNKAADLLEEMNTNTTDGTVTASYVGNDSTQYSTEADTIQIDKQ
ncbi:hypothetical protein [Zunongwangia atlantica]|uniref:Lipoprotein n=1 Tax=Zunongwangia atlantica 22II14-10F7 TaxID=1185767 RepID=A0A1Y1T6S7_9FLAO|nr:hypothetical protein [Zunongwangia atlantica]ORL46771.1 hypothetical protein IIF7_04606 [Zunongwangia atlantica 22II14-10F7]